MNKCLLERFINENKRYLTGAFVFFAVLIAVDKNQDKLFVYPGLRDSVAAHMRDPQSTQFRGEYLSTSGWFCGELNAKNGYGAYTGFKRFIAKAETIEIEGDGYSGSFNEQWSKLCGQE